MNKFTGLQLVYARLEDFILACSRLDLDPHVLIHREEYIVLDGSVYHTSIYNTDEIDFDGSVYHTDEVDFD